jgi:hypothetical protein
MQSKPNLPKTTATRHPAKVIEGLRKAGVPESYIERVFAGRVRGPWHKPGDRPDKKEITDVES